MARALWKGSIGFGLVNVPVRMYPATRDRSLHFHLVHERDGSRIGYEKVCKKEGKRVADREIVKAYEVSSGKVVYLTDKDFEAAQVEGYHSIDIRDFVPYEQIDPIYFAHTYYLGPEAGAERVYALLARAMREAELAAIGTYVMRDREYLGCLRERDGVIVLEQMHFADEVAELDGIAPSRARVDKRELAMATQLIDRFKGDFDPSRYRDTYRAKLRKVVERKRKGKAVEPPQREREKQPPDLMDALTRSLERARGGAGGRLEKLTRDELLARARDSGVRGRSSMSKADLVAALRR